MSNYLLIFIGGGLGSMARYGVAQLISRFPSLEMKFPLATFSANLLSCIVLGFVVGIAGEKLIMQDRLRYFAITGFCGGFSTFSTFSVETLQLIKSGNYGMAGLYIGLSTVLCIGSVMLGMTAGRISG